MGPCPEGRVGRSRLSVKVVLDSGNGFVPSMLANDSMKFRFVEGELMSVNEGEDVGPVLMGAVARGF